MYMPTAITIPTTYDYHYGDDIGNWMPGVSASGTVASATGTSPMAGILFDVRNNGNHDQTTRASMFYHDYKGTETGRRAGANFVNTAGSSESSAADTTLTATQTGPVTVYVSNVSNAEYNIGLGKIKADTLLYIVDQTSDVGKVWNEGDIQTSGATFVNNGNIGSFDNDGLLQSDARAVLEVGSSGIVGDVTNNGTWSGAYAIYNAGTIASFTNKGAVNGGILNYGTITGDVALGGVKLIMAGDSAVLGGTVSGVAGDGSSLVVGDADNVGTYSTTGTVSVDKIGTGAGSTLTVTKDNTWTVNSTYIV